jgi:hypothetical protein
MRSTKQPNLNFDIYIKHPRGTGVIRIPSELLCLPRSQHYAFLRSRFSDPRKVMRLYTVAKHLNILSGLGQMHRIEA